jgi:regulator of sigma E protease
VTLRQAAEAAQNGALGVRINGFESGATTNGIVDAIVIGFRRTIDASTLIIRGVGDLISNIGDPQVAGPIGMVSLVGAYRELPPTFLLWLIALLSANLAIINILPFPPMDGGRMAMAIAQRLSGGRISVSVERAIYFSGFVALMALLVWISIFDLRRLGGG